MIRDGYLGCSFLVHLGSHRISPRHCSLMRLLFSLSTFLFRFPSSFLFKGCFVNSLSSFLVVFPFNSFLRHRADICALATLTKADAERLMHQIIQFYADESNYSYVYGFNKTPRTFDFAEAFKVANELPVYQPPVFSNDEPSS